jgi:CO/xanthine dehydrogenase Mo-binding subunit
MAEAHKLVGSEQSVLGRMDRATGRFRFVTDMKLPDMLVGKVLRSPLPHAIIKDIDLSRARRLPGVACAICWKDVRKRRYGYCVEDEMTFAWDRVRFVGDVVAAVAAVDEATAREALDLIRVDYEPLEPVFDMHRALDPDAPLIHPELESYSLQWDFGVLRYGNVSCHTVIFQGDVEQGFRESDEIFEDTFTTPLVHQCYLEPHATIAQMDFDGKFTLWTSGQGTHYYQYRVHQCLGIPMSKIRVLTPGAGGGFGGKMETYSAHIGAALALYGDPRHPVEVTLKTGVKSDGTLLARQALMLVDNGAYGGQGPALVPYATIYTRGPYKFKYARADGLLVYTNKTYGGAFRGYGCPQAIWAGESQVDKICDTMGFDPVEFRLKNAVHTGDTMITGQEIRTCGYSDTITGALDGARRLYPEGHMQTRHQGPLKPRMSGRGLATKEYSSGFRGTSAIAILREDGTLGIISAGTDIGQGCNTTLAMIAAEEFGCSLEKVSIVTDGDTESTPYDFASIGSRITHSLGRAVQDAARQVREQTLEAATQIMREVGIEIGLNEEVEIADDRIQVKGDPTRSIAIEHVAWKASNLISGNIVAKGVYLPDVGMLPIEKVKSSQYLEFPSQVYSSHLVDVEVDTETGQVKIVGLKAAHDVGFAINRKGCEGQVEGGCAFGVGFGLTEWIKEDKNNRIVTTTMAQHGIPRATDVPSIEAVLVEPGEPTGPFGAKGVGESALVATAPAIMNAIHDAVGIRVYDLPVTPERVLKAIREKHGK